MTQPSVLSNKMSELANIADVLIVKKAAVDAATLAGGGDPAAMGMDPAMMGGGGGDPAAMGGDPMAGGGAPPGPDPMEQRLAALEAQLAAGGGGGGAMGGVEPIKPKIDVNVEIMKMNKMIARIADALGVQIPAAEMVATEADLTGMGMEQEAGGAAAGGGSAIAPIDPMQGASPDLAGGGGGGGKIASEGEAYDGSGLANLESQADALFHMMSEQ